MSRSLIVVFLSVAGALLTLVAAMSSGFFVKAPPRGADAVGLVVPFFAAIAAGIFGVVAGGVAAGGGGLESWGLSRSGAVALLVGVGALVGMAIVGSFLGWSERHSWAPPAAALFSGFILPVGYFGFVWRVAMGGPGSGRASWTLFLGGAAGLAALAGVIASFGMVQTWTRQSAANRAREESERKLQQVEAARVAAQTPEEKLREMLATFSEQAPLWSVVSGLPDEPSPSLRAIRIERALKVPDLDGDLAATLSSDRGFYRHGCAVLIAEAAESALRPQAWAAHLAVDAKLTAEDVRKAGDLARHEEDDLAAHVGAIARASARLSRTEALEKALQNLQQRLMALPATEQRVRAVAALEAALAQTGRM